MAYISTTDERYGGTYLSSSAGARDAPYSLAAGYVLAQGIAAAGYGGVGVDSRDWGGLGGWGVGWWVEVAEEC